MFLSRGDRDLGVAFQTHPGRQAFISSGSKELRSAFESRRVSLGCSRAAAAVCGFSRGTTARSVSRSWGAGEVGSPCEWRGGARQCSRAMVGESGPERVEE